MPVELIALNPIEKVRVYRFPNGASVRLENVTHFKSTTTHRLKTGDGKLHIVPEGWIHIEIDTETFTV